MARSRGDAEWRSARGRLVEAIRSGRISGREAMEALGVSAATLSGWVSAEKRREKRVAIATPGFVAVDVLEEPAACAPVAVVEVGNGIRVRVEAGFDAAELLRLARALSSPC